MTYGEVLMYYLEIKDISRAELARRISESLGKKVSRGQITELCNGKTKEPTLSRAKAIADALGVTLQEMCDMMEDD